ncbi:helix-turn-helix domain-containing protein [Lutimaribacter marinistellae]|uniref:Helix-turn-helix domain-containing protein n=1 Tax=Lutimaribacter marinistellae TaxID=1820329 RepID=A0ABV7TLF8_9RHOB
MTIHDADWLQGFDLDIDTAHDLARPFYAVNTLQNQPELQIAARLEPYRNLVATAVQLSGLRIDRDGRHTRGGLEPVLLIETYRTGSTCGIQGPQRTCVDANTVHIIDFSRPYAGIVKDARGIGALIPHAALQYDPSHDPSYLSFRKDTSHGAGLGLALELFVEEVMTGLTVQAELKAQTLLSLIRAALDGEAAKAEDPQQDLSRALLVERYIAKNVGREDLGTERICRDLAMSRATLYRVFGKGGIEARVRDERLDRCLADLLRAPKFHGAVRQVSNRWGFHDASNFRRAFHTRFGVSPSDCIAQSAFETS